MTEARSTIAPENLQEVLDAENSPGQAMWGGQQQYCTPKWLAEQCQAKLPSTRPATILDPQVGEGSLVALDTYAYGCSRFGVDIDNRLSIHGVTLVTGNIVKVTEIIEDICPDIRFCCINANPPFGKRWKVGDGKPMDSTEFTWKFVTKYGNYGYFIANNKTLVELGIAPDLGVPIHNFAADASSLQGSKAHPWLTRYEIHQANTIWPGLSPKLHIGIVFWKRPIERAASETWKPDWTHSTQGEIHAAWERIARIVNEEKVSRPPFNIYVDDDGMLRTYLSVRSEVKLKLSKEQILRLHRINNCHPLTLTTEKETRVLMKELVDGGIYTVQPEAKAAVENAIAEINALACPIMPVTDFETVAYADEEEALTCTATVNEDNMQFTAGKTYTLTTGSYKFTERFDRNKIHFNEETEETYTSKHECQLSGRDRYIEFKDDRGRVIKFMDRPRQGMANEQPEKRLWEIFQRPTVQTVAELREAAVTQNAAVLKSCELMSNYRYYEGQFEYLKRLATKDCGLGAGATGTGKTLMAISLLAMKGPERALIIAPQGALRSSESDDEEEDSAEEFSASQWVQELHRFAPFLQVWEIFSYDDYRRILTLNNGVLPPGVYISYYEAMFRNGALESAPSSWDDDKLNRWGEAKGLGQLEVGDDKTHWCDSVGKEVNGIRCIIEPCLATKIGHLFDMVICDEAHVACNLGANITQMLIRLQPKYRWALTATPIPNIVSNLFSLMGWLCVPDWYKGERRNAAWPYARDEIGRFNGTFLTTERDFTQEAINKKKDPKYRGICIKDSPIISSPARLLKLLKPTMAYLSKEQCSPTYIAPKIIDVRVKMGKEQSALYAHFLDRANIPCEHPLVRARKQSAWLRGICCDPKGFRHHTKTSPKVTSNMNPKVIATLELVSDILARGETVVIINSRVGITDTLEEMLNDAGVPLARIDSTISAEQHAYQANLFKRERAKVMLMGLKCAAAYSFDMCDNEIIGSLEYSPGPFFQACGRVDRVTNKKVKNIYCILVQNSIEEVQFETVAIKGDAATICLKGQRVPREFKPVDPSEVMADAWKRFDLSGSTPEPECEQQWPKLRKKISDALQISLAN